MIPLSVVRPALPADAPAVSSILTEAAAWSKNKEHGCGVTMNFWLNASPRISRTGSYFLAEVGGETAGTVKFQWEDPLFWPDEPVGEAAYVHRLAVRRRFAGGAVSRALLRYAAARAREDGRRFLRLDCEASRPRLRAFYERVGFRHHSDRQIGPYFVARYECALAACTPLFP